MTLRFNGSTDYLNFLQSVKTTFPVSIVAWFRPNDVTNLQCILSLGPQGTDTARIGLYVDGSAASDPVKAISRTTTDTPATTTTGVTLGRWHHGAAVFLNNANRSAWIDGGSKGVNATTKNWTSANHTAIAVSASSAFGQKFNGDIAEVAVYGAPLADHEVLALASGASPFSFRANNLLLYMNFLEGIAVNLMNGWRFTITGSPVTVDTYPRLTGISDPIFVVDYAGGLSTVGQELQTKWNINVLAGQTLQGKWNLKVLAGQELQAKWNIRALAGSSLQALWNIRALAGNNLQAKWNLKTLVGSELQGKWNILNLAGQSLQALWNIRALAGSSLQAIWNMSGSVGNALQAVWNIAGSVGSNLQAKWNMFVLAGQGLQAKWNVNVLAGQSTQAVWNIRTPVGASLEAKYNVAGSVGSDLQAVWNILGVPGPEAGPHWTVPRGGWFLPGVRTVRE